MDKFSLDVSCYSKIFLHSLFKRLLFALIGLTVCGTHEIAIADSVCSPTQTIDGALVYPSADCCPLKTSYTDCGECVGIGYVQKLQKDCSGVCKPLEKGSRSRFDSSCTLQCLPPDAPYYERYGCPDGKTRCAPAGQFAGQVCGADYCKQGEFLTTTGKCCDPSQLDSSGNDCCDTSLRDCKGLCPSPARAPYLPDDCGVCGGNNQSKGCDGVCGSKMRRDVCGVCGGDGSTCCSPDRVGCDGKCDSGRRLDKCGVCGGDGSTCSILGCDCIPLSEGGKSLDACGVCGGNGSSCKGCDGTYYPQGGAPKLDACSLACSRSDDIGASCNGCDGIQGSNKIVDLCGVCGGDGSSCLDCLGIPFGRARFDLCGVCRDPKDANWNFCLDNTGVRRFNLACGPRCEPVNKPVPSPSWGGQTVKVAPYIDPKDPLCKSELSAQSVEGRVQSSASSANLSDNLQSPASSEALAAESSGKQRLRVASKSYLEASSVLESKASNNSTTFNIPEFEPFSSSGNLATGITANTGPYTVASGNMVVDIPALGKRNANFHTILNRDPAKFCCPSLFSYTAQGNASPGKGWVGVNPNTQYRFSIIYKSTDDYSHPNYLNKQEWSNDNSVSQEGLFDLNRRISLGDGWYYAWSVFTTGPKTSSVSISSFDYRYFNQVSLLVANVSLSREVTSTMPTSTPSNLPCEPYDDGSGAWRYTGVWNHLNNLGWPISGSLSLTNDLNARAVIQFTGSGFRLFYTKSDNRGLISLFVDGAKVADINANGKFEPRAFYEVTSLNNGPHTVEIRHGGGARGSFIDVDALQIFGTCQDVNSLQVTAGVNDDNFNRWVFSGLWNHSIFESGANLGTLSITDDLSARVSTRIVGEGFRLLFTRNSNRGILSIFVDGEKIADVNAANSSLQWQAVFEKTGLKPGPHIVEVRHGGGATPSLIDIDAIEILPSVVPPTPILTGTPTSVASPSVTPTITAVVPLDPECRGVTPCIDVDITNTLLGLDKTAAGLRDLALVNMKTLEKRVNRLKSSKDRKQLLAFIKKNRVVAKTNYDKAWRIVYTIGTRINDKYVTSECPSGGLCSRSYSSVFETYTGGINSLRNINTGVAKWFLKLKDSQKAAKIRKQAEFFIEVSRGLILKVPSPKPNCIKAEGNMVPTLNPRCLITPTAIPTITNTPTATFTSTPIAPLVITPGSVNLFTTEPGNTQKFSASGGREPYKFSIASGEGSINAFSGDFIAGSKDTTVRVTDADGTTSDAVVTVKTHIFDVYHSYTRVNSCCIGGPSCADICAANGGKLVPIHTTTNPGYQLGLKNVWYWNHCWKGYFENPLTGDRAIAVDPDSGSSWRYVAPGCLGLKSAAPWLYYESAPGQVLVTTPGDGVTYTEVSATCSCSR